MPPNRLLIEAEEQLTDSLLTKLEVAIQRHYKPMTGVRCIADLGLVVRQRRLRPPRHRPRRPMATGWGNGRYGIVTSPLDRVYPERHPFRLLQLNWNLPPDMSAPIIFRSNRIFAIENIV